MKTENTMELLAQEVESVAYQAADTFFKDIMEGEDRGCCGFAWVTITPEHKGNTRLGKEERREYKALGAKPDWTGRTWMIWNPSGYPVQNIDTLEAGARAAAELLRQNGINASVGSRLD